MKLAPAIRAVMLRRLRRVLSHALAAKVVDEIERDLESGTVETVKPTELDLKRAERTARRLGWKVRG